MLLIVHPLPSDTQTPIPFSICCCDTAKLGKKSLGLYNYYLRPTIEIGWLINIVLILPLNKCNF